jgi:hypothetical protein
MPGVRVTSPSVVWAFMAEAYVRPSEWSVISEVARWRLPAWRPWVRWLAALVWPLVAWPPAAADT